MSKPWYKSVKKVLGVIGFIFYWIVQIPAIIKDPTVITQLAMTNAGMVLGLLGIATVGHVAHKVTTKKDLPE